MTLNKFLRQYQHVIISIVIILFCAGGVLFAAIPSIQKTQELIRELSAIKQETSMYANKLETLHVLNEDELRNQLTQVLSAVPTDRSFPTLFETVEGVGLQTGISIRSMNIIGGTTLATSAASKVSAGDKKIGTHTVPFNVSVEGSLDALEQFITIAPRVRRLLRIKSFSISFPKNESPVAISIEMDAFYEPLPATLGTAKSTLSLLTEEDLGVINTLTRFPLATQNMSESPHPLVGKVKENPFSP